MIESIVRMHKAMRLACKLVNQDEGDYGMASEELLVIGVKEEKTSLDVCDLLKKQGFSILIYMGPIGRYVIEARPKEVE